MPTIQPTQYHLTDNISQAVLAVISNGQNYVPSVGIMFTRSNVSADVPRIEVDVSNINRASLHMGFVTQTSSWFYDHFSADVGIKIVTDRNGSSGANHEDVVQSVRYLMSREAQTLISPVVTWYNVLDVIEEGEAHEIDGDMREDHSSLKFRLELGIIAANYAVPSVGSAL
jgi:hypothetical protein